MEEESQGRQIIETSIPSIVFMGTPDFAVPSLLKLVKAGVSIRLVVTQPDRPSGRGMKVAAPPVKGAAEKLGIPVFPAAESEGHRDHRTHKRGRGRVRGCGGLLGKYCHRRFWMLSRWVS